MIIEWWEGAKNDLDCIYEYLVDFNEHLAVKVYNQLIDEVERLILYSESLAIEPLIKSKKYTFRSSIVISGRYKIIYFVDSKHIVITHIWDCRRNSESIRQYFK